MNRNWKIVTGVIVVVVVVLGLANFSKQRSVPVEESVDVNNARDVAAGATTGGASDITPAQVPATGQVDDAVNALISGAAADQNAAIAVDAVETVGTSDQSVNNFGQYEQF